MKERIKFKKMFTPKPTQTLKQMNIVTLSWKQKQKKSKFLLNLSFQSKAILVVLGFDAQSRNFGSVVHQTYGFQKSESWLLSINAPIIQFSIWMTVMTHKILWPLVLHPLDIGILDQVFLHFLQSIFLRYGVSIEFGMIWKNMQNIFSNVFCIS